MGGQGGPAPGSCWAAGRGWGWGWGCRGWQGEPWLGGASVVAGGGPRRPPREPWLGEAHWAIFRLPLALFPVQSVSNGSGAPSANQDAWSKPQKAGRLASPDPGHKFPPDLGAHGRHKSTTPCWSWAAWRPATERQGHGQPLVHAPLRGRAPASFQPNSIPSPFAGAPTGLTSAGGTRAPPVCQPLRHEALTRHRLWMGTGGSGEGRWGERRPARGAQRPQPHPCLLLQP